MSTPAQVIANQANSQKSTGPVTEQGKAASSINRRSHGLGGNFTVLPFENQAEFDVLLANLDAEYQPAVPSELLLVERMAESRWLSERALRLQQTSLDPNTGEIADEKKFSLYQRYFTTHNNAFHKAMNDLLKQRKLKHDMQIGFERERRYQEEHPFKLSIKACAINDEESNRGIPNSAGKTARNAIIDRRWAEMSAQAA